MKTLSQRLSTKIGLSSQDVDALLKIVASEMFIELRTKNYFNYPGFGLFKVVASSNDLQIKFTLSKRMHAKLAKILSAERKHEIIFE